MMNWRLGGLILVLLLAGCATGVSSGYGQGGRNADGRSYSEARADNMLSARVNTLLVQDRQIPAMAIRVSTRDGVVTLTGRVPSRAVAERAERLAASVDGVVAVVNHLQPAP
jgi:hyperosmotically inducible protein